MPFDASPIGIFDSGLGGVSVLKTAVQHLPNEHFIYYGDNLHAPYGTKTPEKVLALSYQAVDFLLHKQAKAIVIACNTATAHAAQALRARYSLPIIGMEPALKPAFSMRKQGKILVLATPNTLHSKKYDLLHEQFGDHSISLPCPGLMEYVEEMDLASSALHAHLGALFAPYEKETIDVVVLGCTHYVFLKQAIAMHFPKTTQLIDGNFGTVQQLQRRLFSIDALAKSDQEGSVTCYSSAGQPFEEKIKALFSI